MMYTTLLACSTATDLVLGLGSLCMPVHFSACEPADNIRMSRQLCIDSVWGDSAVCSSLVSYAELPAVLLPSVPLLL